MSGKPAGHNLIVDGHSMVYRDHIVGGDVKQNASNRIAIMKERYKIDTVYTCWDSGGSFRDDLMPGYKGTRSKPDGIDEAIADTQAAMRDDGYQVLHSPGFEGDDVVATMTSRSVADDRCVTIYSSDRDLHQLLIRNWVRQLRKFKMNYGHVVEEWRTHDGKHGLIAKYGVSPEQWVDFRIMTGDPSDGIAGFAKVGAVRAAKVLAHFGTLEAYYAKPSEHGVLDAAINTALLDGQQNVELFRELLTLRFDVEPVSVF